MTQPKGIFQVNNTKIYYYRPSRKWRCTTLFNELIAQCKTKKQAIKWAKEREKY